MIALVEASPEEQLARNLDAVRYAEGASEPKARAWLASLWNNIGMSQHDAGRLDEALAAFERALALRREQGNAPRIRIARWMVAWTHRLLGRLDAALAEQQALEAEGEAAGQADGYVLFELAELHLGVGRGGTARNARRSSAITRSGRPRHWPTSRWIRRSGSGCGSSARCRTTKFDGSLSRVWRPLGRAAALGARGVRR